MPKVNKMDGSTIAEDGKLVRDNFLDCMASMEIDQESGQMIWEWILLPILEKKNSSDVFIFIDNNILALREAARRRHDLAAFKSIAQFLVNGEIQGNREAGPLSDDWRAHLEKIGYPEPSAETIPKGKPTIH